MGNPLDPRGFGAISGFEHEAMLSPFKIEEFFADPRFPLTVYHDFRDKALELHTHEFGELVYVRRGQGLHVTVAGEYALEAGDVFYIPEGMPHGYASPRHLDLFNILFLPDKLPLNRESLECLPGFRLLFMLEPALRREHRFKSHLRLPSDDVLAIQPLIQRLTDETTSRPPGYETMATGLFLEIVALLARSYGRRPNTMSGHLMSIDGVLQFLNQHSDEDLDIPGLAARAKMSERTFHRVFQSSTGLTPMAYLLERRIARAKDLLQVPGSRITDVAYRCGFHDGNYFSRAFRAQVGVSPSQWQRAARGRVAE